MENNKNFSSEYLEEHYKNLENDFRNSNLIKLISKKIRGKTILDIGCGSGIFLKSMENRDAELIGIEPDKELFKLAKKNNPQAKIINGMAQDIDKLVNKKMKNIVMMDVLEFIKKDEEILKKLYFNIDKKGQLILVLPAHPFLYGKRDRIQGHVRRYSKKRTEFILNNNGFKIKSIRYWNMLGFFPYLFYEKVLNKKLDTELRNSDKGKFLNKMLDFWFYYIENNLNLGFGLSLIVTAEK